MLLTEGEYKLPADLKANVVHGDTVVVMKRSQREIIGYTKNCGHCIHQKCGRLSSRNQWWDSKYCELKPKSIHGELKYFYAANDGKAACDLFEKR